jgi:carboxyl-terminal processing protease
MLERVIRYVKNEYFKPVRPEKIAPAAIRGMLNYLDPNSSYLNPEQTKLFENRWNLELGDIGVILIKRYSYPQIIGIIENSPAQESGLKIGDYISSINGETTYKKGIWEVRLSLKGNINSEVYLKIMRNNSLLKLKVKREKIYDSYFNIQKIKNNYLLKINYFPSNLRNLINALKKIENKAKGLIIDLRNCYDGKIISGFNLANVFIPSGKAFFVKRKDKTIKEYYFKKENYFSNLPLVVIVNKATMSGGELFALLLKKFKRAKIIGESTFGILSETKVFKMDDGSGIVLTTGMIFLEKDKKIWGKGVKPDITLKEKENPVQKAIKLLGS